MLGLHELLKQLTTGRGPLSVADPTVVRAIDYTQLSIAVDTGVCRVTGAESLTRTRVARPHGAPLTGNNVQVGEFDQWCEVVVLGDDREVAGGGACGDPEVVDVDPPAGFG